MKDAKRARITLIRSDEEVRPETLGRSSSQVQHVELWVRPPDSERLEEIQLSARLCSCRSVCLAVVEDAVDTLKS